LWMVCRNLNRLVFSSAFRANEGEVYV
jgi:hypothetical protein